MRIYLFAFAVFFSVFGCGDSQTEGEVIVLDLAVDAASPLDASLDSELDQFIETADVSISPDLGLPICEPPLELTSLNCKI
jgi:hypothetical protein